MWTGQSCTGCNAVLAGQVLLFFVTCRLMSRVANFCTLRPCIVKHTFAKLQQIAASDMREEHTSMQKVWCSYVDYVHTEHGHSRRCFYAVIYAAHLAVLRSASTTLSLLEGSSTNMDTLSLALNADFLAISWSKVSALVGVRATRSLLQVTPLTGNCRGGINGTWGKHEREFSSSG